MSCLFILKGILAESLGEDSNEHLFTLVEGIVDTSKNGGGNSGSREDILIGDEEGEQSTASVEDQLHKEMTVYEVCGFLDNLEILLKFSLTGWGGFLEAVNPFSYRMRSASWEILSN